MSNEGKNYNNKNEYLKNNNSVINNKSLDKIRTRGVEITSPTLIFILYWSNINYHNYHIKYHNHNLHVNTNPDLYHNWFNKMYILILYKCTQVHQWLNKICVMFFNNWFCLEKFDNHDIKKIICLFVQESNSPCGLCKGRFKFTAIILKLNLAPIIWKGYRQWLKLFYLYQ